MPEDDLFDVFQLVSCGLDRRLQLVLGLIFYTCEDIRHRGTPDFWVIFSTARLPQDQSFVRVLNQNAVHGQLTTLVDESFVFCALQTGVASTDDKGLVALEPADLEEMELGAFWAHI